MGFNVNPPKPGRKGTWAIAPRAGASLGSDMRVLFAALPILSLAACAQLAQPVAEAPAETEPFDGVRPMARPADLAARGRKPPAGARTAEAFDTTTQEERAAAAAPAPPPSTGPIGSTIASLGDPTDQGFWLKTPLVKSIRPGRVVYPANGKAVQVELRPSGGDVGSGSQISLAAMRIIEAPLTDLVEIEVFGE